MTKASKIAASIIIPSYNSQNTIVKCLESLIQQVDFRATEIIVVDSSSDATPQLIKETFNEVNLIQLPTKTLPGAARNIGIQAARGKFLLFIDSDCIAGPQWVATMTNLHFRHGCAGVGGWIENGFPRSLISWAGYFLEFSEFLPIQQPQYVTHIPTCTISYKRPVFENYGTFAADIFPGEDQEFNRRLVMAGEKILLDPGIYVRHLHRSDLRSFLRHQARIGRGGVKMRRKGNFGSSFIVQTPLLLPAIVPAVMGARLILCLKRAVGHSHDILLSWLKSLPLYLLGLLFWAYGFGSEVISGNGNNRSHTEQRISRPIP